MSGFANTYRFLELSLKLFNLLMKKIALCVYDYKRNQLIISAELFSVNDHFWQVNGIVKAGNQNLALK